MTVSSVGAGSTVFTRRLAEMCNEMETLSRQLSTGKKAETFAELVRMAMKAGISADSPGG